jgi:uncharacterized protein
MPPEETCTAFDGHRRLASGPLSEVAVAVKRAMEDGAARPILIFDDATGRAIDIDTRGAEGEVAARYAPPTRGRGRPKLGVVAREVTLLPRHWDWLNRQSGGASVALRKLVEEARRGGDSNREARDAAYHFMSAMAGDLPGFEEAARALFAGDQPRFESLIAGWPDDVRAHALGLAFADKEP